MNQPLTNKSNSWQKKHLSFRPWKTVKAANVSGKKHWKKWLKGRLLLLLLLLQRAQRMREWFMRHEIERKTSPRPRRRRRRRHFCKRWRAAVGIFPSPCNLYVRQLSNCVCVDRSAQGKNKSKAGEHGQCPAMEPQPTGKSEKHLSQLLLSVLETASNEMKMTRQLRECVIIISLARPMPIEIFHLSIRVA